MSAYLYAKPDIEHLLRAHCQHLVSINPAQLKTIRMPVFLASLLSYSAVVVHAYFSGWYVHT